MDLFQWYSFNLFCVESFNKYYEFFNLLIPFYLSTNTFSTCLLNATFLAFYFVEECETHIFIIMLIQNTHSFENDSTTGISICMW